MEQHGDNPRQFVCAVIPARYASTRLPGKMLLDIVGQPLIIHTAQRASEACTVDRVIVATDDERIYKAVISAGFESVITSPEHQSGSDRVAEVASGLPEGTIVVNVQGDEPLISPETIDRAVETMRSSAEPRPDIVTTFEKITSANELEDPNVVKVVTTEDGRALYFSRSLMPFPRESAIKYGSTRKAFTMEPELFRNYKKHTGIYVYTREFLLEYSALPPTPLEMIEMLEQLRALENGALIKVVESASRSIGVDTEADLERVRAIAGSRAGAMQSEVTTNV